MSQVFPCPACEATYESESALEAHLTVRHRCPECGWLFPNYPDVEQHRATQHGNVHFLGPPIKPEFSTIVKTEGWTPAKSPRPSDPEKLYEWLYSLCLQITTAKRPETALLAAQDTLSAQVQYAKQNFKRITDAMKLKRYTRVTNPTHRACRLVIALAHLDCTVSVAWDRHRIALSELIRRKTGKHIPPSK